MKRRRVYRWLMIGALMLAAGVGLDGLWIHAMAALEQLLLARAWGRSEHRRGARRPWADMAPLARLSVPRLHQDLLILDDGRRHVLAFGSDWTPGSTMPGTHGLSVIGAHRDTQFRFLQILWPDDRLHLDGPRGGSDYQVTGTYIIDSRRARIPAASGMDGLWLVTRYPFDAIVPGGPLRYMVQARRTNLNTVSHRSSLPAGTNAKAPGHTL